MGNPTDRKSKFENTSQGVLGVVQFDIEGKPKGVPVPYKGIVFLSEEEQILTANAPRNESDNPFLNGLKLLERGAEMDRARPIGEEQDTPGQPAEPEPDPAPPADPPSDPEPPAAEVPPEPAEITQERPPQPAAPAPSSASGPSGGAEVVEAGDGRQVRSAMRPSASPAAATPPPAAAAPPAKAAD